MLRTALSKANELLFKYNSKSTHSLWNFLHRWNYEHTWTKNMLSAANKVLRATNRYHVFRWDWMVGVLGCGVGLMVTWMQDAYYEVKIGYKPLVKRLVVEKVLHNDVVKDQLKEVIDMNVLSNQEIQYYVQQILLNQVLNPQKDNIKLLINAAIHSFLQPENSAAIQQLVSQNVNKLNNPIKNAALDFLNGPQMDRITANGLSSVLGSLYIKSFIGDQVRGSLVGYLSNTGNVDSLYSGIRQNFIF